jgi:large subunit ribosomal protein L5
LAYRSIANNNLMKKDLRSFYKQTIVPSLINDFGYKNVEQVPKVIAVSINRGFGEAAKKFKRA